MRFVYNDGGRLAAGFKGRTGDCVVRAIAIAAKLPYADVYRAITLRSVSERTKSDRKRSSARNGVWRRTYQRYLESLGATWTPTMRIGSGCTVHLRAEELPMGRLVVSVSRHLVAVIDGVMHDTHKIDRNETRCVYGYYTLETKEIT